MLFQYSTLTSPNPFPQPLISRFSVHHVAIHESPKTLTTDTYLTPDSGTGTHSGRHLSQAPLPCREDPVKVRRQARIVVYCISPVLRRRSR